MIFTVEIAQYVYNVTTALAAGKTFEVMTNECPECGEALGFFNTDGHIVYDASTDDDAERVIIIVACEGYWMIDPNLVGIVSKGWMSADEQTVTFDEPHNCHDHPIGGDASMGESDDVQGEATDRAASVTWGPWGDDGRAGV